MPHSPQAILETSLYVDDLATARPFYEGLLGLTVVDEQPGRHLFFRCGQGMLLLFIANACAQPGGMLPTHGAQGPGHMAFKATEAELAAWRAHLEAQGVAIEAMVDWPNGGRSIYFRDPAGNSVEFATPKLWGLAE